MRQKVVPLLRYFKFNTSYSIGSLNSEIAQVLFCTKKYYFCYIKNHILQAHGSDCSIF